MDFVSTRIITDDIKGLVRFYENIGLTSRWLTDEFAEMVSPTCTLAIGSTRTMNQFFGGAASPASNRSLLFRDPDGNLINFFTPMTPEAMRRFAKS